MPNSCTFSGTNGNLSIWCRKGIRGYSDGDYFYFVLPDHRLADQGALGWTGNRTLFYYHPCGPWGKTIGWVYGAFEMPKEAEDLAIVSCETWPFFMAFGATVNGENLPGLRGFTIYVGYGGLHVSALIQLAKTRKEHFRSLEGVTVVLERDPEADVIQEVESFREFMGKLTHGFCEAPKFWKECKYRDRWSTLNHDGLPKYDIRS